MNYSIKIGEIFLIKVAVRKCMRLNYCTKFQELAVSKLFDRIVKDCLDNGHICCTKYFD